MIFNETHKHLITDFKKFYIDNIDEFMNVLELVRATCPEDRLVYTDPL